MFFVLIFFFITIFMEKRIFEWREKASKILRLAHAENAMFSFLGHPFGRIPVPKLQTSTWAWAWRVQGASGHRCRTNRQEIGIHSQVRPIISEKNKSTEGGWLPVWMLWNTWLGSISSASWLLSVEVLEVFLGVGEFQENGGVHGTRPAFSGYFRLSRSCSVGVRQCRDLDGGAG